MAGCSRVPMPTMIQTWQLLLRQVYVTILRLHHLLQTASMTAGPHPDRENTATHMHRKQNHVYLYHLLWNCRHLMLMLCYHLLKMHLRKKPMHVNMAVGKAHISNIKHRSSTEGPRLRDREWQGVSMKAREDMGCSFRCTTS
jgi:hypothetical protein